MVLFQPKGEKQQGLGYMGSDQRFQETRKMPHCPSELGALISQVEELQLLQTVSKFQHSRCHVVDSRSRVFSRVDNLIEIPTQDPWARVKTKRLLEMQEVTPEVSAFFTFVWSINDCEIKSVSPLNNNFTG